MITFIKSNIAHLGGLEKYARALIEDFCASNVPVTLLTTHGDRWTFTHPLLSVVSFPVSKPLSVVKIRQFDAHCQRYLKEHPTPIVFSLDRNRRQTHIRAGNGVHPAFLASRAKHEPLLKRWSFPLNPLHRTILSIEREAFEHPDLKRLFVNAEQVKRDVLAHYDVDPKKICVVHNGVEWRAMEPHFAAWEEKRPVCAAHLGLNLECYQLLFLGHNFKRKGLDRLLAALARLKDRHVQLSVVGHDKHLALYRRKAERLGLKERVFFFGATQETYSFFQLADALAIPSYYDPFANVTVEALGMGLFVLSSKENGGHEILQKEMGETLDDADDPDCFARALEKAMARPKTAERACALRKSVEHLDFAEQLKKITQLTLAP